MRSIALEVLAARDNVRSQRDETPLFISLTTTKKLVFLFPSVCVFITVLEINTSSPLTCFRPQSVMCLPLK